MSVAAFFHGRRDRRLMALAGIALVSVGSALGALWWREAVLAPRYQPMLLFPGLDAKLARGETTHIYIVSKTYGSFEVAFNPIKGWVLPGKANYPVSRQTLNQTLAVFARMQTVEPKTNRPDWFHYVDLDPPPQGDGVLVTLSADKGYVLAAMVVGKAVPLGEDTGLFVRRAGEDQSFLVRSPSAIKANPADWMDKTVVSLAAQRVALAEVKPASGAPYSVSRPAPGDSFAVAPLPKGRELAYAGAADTIAAALADFTFDDIQPAGSFDFDKAARLQLHCFDGLTVTVDLAQQGSDTWVRLLAQAAPGNPAAAKEAFNINARAEGWTFKLPAYKAAVFAPTLESLLKPKK